MTAAGGIDCADALDELYPYLDGELTSERAEAVRAHLAACAPCFAHFELEENFLHFLKARAASRGAPDLVKRQILNRLSRTGRRDRR